MAKEKSFADKVRTEFKNVKDSTKDFEKKDMENNKGMAVLSYIIPPVPYFVDTKSKYVKYHATQGMNLFVVAVIYAIASGLLRSAIKVSKSCWGIENCYEVTPWWVEWPLNIIGIIIGIIAIIGIINVCNNKAKELPFVSKLKFFK